MEVKKGISKGVIIACLIIAILVVCIVVGAFYIYYGSPKEVYQESLTGGDISLTYSDEENLFAIENAIPTSDIVGKAYDSADLFFDFSVFAVFSKSSKYSSEVPAKKNKLGSFHISHRMSVLSA